MDEKSEEKKKNNNEDELDFTKDEFYNELIKFEDKIINDAIELVDHALSLVNSKYFDDGIEVLREAHFLYDQIGRTNEMEAIDQKISEIYMLKEEEFRETEIKPVKIPDELIAQYQDDVTNVQESEVKLSFSPEELVEEAKRLVEIDEFDEAIEKYEEAIKLFNEINNNSEIEKVYGLIEECYQFQAKTRKPEREIVSEKEELVAEQNTINDIEEISLKKIEKQEKLKKFEESKNKIEQISSKAFELMESASKCVKVYDFDNALILYNDAANLFNEINWENEYKTVISTINKLSEEKESIIKNIEKKHELEIIESEKKAEQATILEQEEKRRVELKEKERVERITTLEQKKIEGENFQNHIADLVNSADKIAREYELDKKKAIKKGNFTLKMSKYPEIIEIYNDIYKKLITKGWKDQAEIYKNQIKIYRDKLEKDNKLYEIEVKKKKQDLLYSKSLKIEEVKGTKSMGREKKKAEDEEFQNEITTIIDDAEKKGREYELALKRRQFEIMCPYPEIIEMYNDVYKKLITKGWKDQAEIYINQIKIYHSKIEKDKKLRAIELKKVEEDKRYQESLKVKKMDTGATDRLKALGEKSKDDDFQNEIIDMVNKADKLAREYNTGIKRGNFNLEPPFEQIINIYEEIRKNLIKRGWNDQAAIYLNQIGIVKQKLEKDKKLREIEAKKRESDDIYQESIKFKKSETSDLTKLNVLEEKYKQDEIFQKGIMDKVNKADKLVREYEIEIRKGNFDKEAPYENVLDIYSDIHKKFKKKGWNDQAEIYLNQINIIKQKIENDKRLRVIETQKIQKQKDYEEMLKSKKDDKGLKSDLDNLQAIENLYQKELDEENFENQITELVEKADKIGRNYELSIRYGQFEVDCVYPQLIEIYKEIKKKLNDRNWTNEARMYSNQIKLYEEKIEQDKRLRQIEAQKKKKEIEYQELMHYKKDVDDSRGIQRVQEIESKKKEADTVVAQAFHLIDQAEVLSKNYASTRKERILQTKAPYDKIINLYKQARRILAENIDWKVESVRLIDTIKFYKDKQERDDKIRAIEIEKLEEAKIKSKTLPIEVDKKYLSREQKIIEYEREKEEKDNLSNQAFDMIDKAEGLAKNYEFNLKSGIFLDSPYKEIIKIYRKAKQKFEEMGWNNQANKLNTTINYYKQKSEADGELRALEAEKIEKQKIDSEEQRLIIERDRKKRIELIKQKKEDYLSKHKEKTLFETEREKAFRLMDQAKSKFNQNNFEGAIELYKESQSIFLEIKWAAGVKMVQDSIVVIKKKFNEFETRKKSFKEKKDKELILEKALDDKIAKSQKTMKIQQKKKRMELLQIQNNKVQEREASDRAYDLLAQGTKLLNRKKFKEAQKKYTDARDTFKQIGWFHEVSRINNELLLKLRKEEKNIEKFREYQKKQEQEVNEVENLLKIAEKQKIELEKAKTKKIETRVFDKLKSKIDDRLNEANLDIIKFKLNEGILKLKEVIKMMNRVGWEDDVNEINEQIEELIKNSRIPILVLEEIDENEDMDKIKYAYEALDKAQMSLSKSQFKKVLSELNEVKFNLEETKISKKFMEKIEKIVNILKKDLDKNKIIEEIPEKAEVEIITQIEPSADIAYKYMDKSKREERRYRFSKAIEFAIMAKKMFINLGSGWNHEHETINKYIDSIKNKKSAREQLFKQKREEIEEKETTLKKEEEEFKTRIATRREERRKKIKELMEKK